MQILHVEGGDVQLCGWGPICEPGDKPCLHGGGFYIWMGFQATEDVGYAISASNANIAALDGRNTQAKQIVRATCVILRVIVRPLTMQWDVGTCCYILHRLLRPQCPLVESLCFQVIDKIDKYFSLFALKMGTIHRCTEFAYDVSCIIGTYLNACMKASENVSISDPGGKTPASLQYLRGKLIHGRYMLCTLLPSLKTLLLTHSSERAAAARRAKEPAPGPAIGGPMVPGLGVGRGSGGDAPPSQRQVPADDNPCTNP